MNEKQQKAITVLGMWLVALAGSVYGLVLTIIGNLLDWGPGSGMEGPMWKVLLLGIVSILLAVYAGELVFRKLSKKIVEKELTAVKYALWFVIILFIASMIAFIIGWEVGYLMGKLTGLIEGLEWGEILWKVPVMSFMFGTPICAVISIIFGLFVLFLLRVEKK